MWYCFKVENNTLKTIQKILPALVLILFLIPIITSSLLDLEQRKVNEKIAAELKLKKDAEDKIEKIYLMGKFEPSERSDFTAVPNKYGISGYKMYLRKETLTAFIQMAMDAQEDGVVLKIASATRNFDYQKNLWDNKWTGATIVEGKDLSKSIPDGLERFKKILEFSAVPGTSRHHWGTDIDLNAATPEYFEKEEGEKVYEWLEDNAASYGFCQPYTLKGADRPVGYNEEKWHWSYLPLSKKFTEEYKDLITDADIAGFDGDKYTEGKDLINNYVLGINPECL